MGRIARSIVRQRIPEALAVGQPLEFSDRGRQTLFRFRRFEPQAGWTQTFPPTPGTHEITVDPGELSSGVDFGNWQPASGEIRGTKWNDLNGNAARDGGEPGIANWTIRLDDGLHVVTGLTDANGDYGFMNVAPGTYVVSETQLAGWVQTFPPGTDHDVTVGPEDVIVGVDFGNLPPADPGSGCVDALELDLVSGDLVLSWQTSCVTSDVDYEVYEGDLGSWDTHLAVVCSTNGLPQAVFAAPNESTYYLVVPTNLVREGSYGESQPGLERPPGTSSCLPQTVNPCP